MAYPSPVFTPKKNGGNGQRSQPNSQSPFNNSMESMSPDFIPFNYSSPQKGNWAQRGHRRYFNNSNSNSFSSSGSGYSPYHGRQNRRGNFNRNSYNNGSNYSNNTNYYDHSMLEDPWAELESDAKKDPVQVDEVKDIKTEEVVTG